MSLVSTPKKAFLVRAVIDGCSPYITLPRATRDAIAEHLPVSFDRNLNLYLWDTASEDYVAITSSPSALTFSFMPDSDSAEPLKIRALFMHLNLTLDEPLVDSPTPCFPCHVKDDETYVLGRAFLQDAFFGANWHPDADVWWLALVPGLRVQSSPNVVEIGETSSEISSGDNEWEASWEGVWDDTDDTTPETTATSPPSDEEPQEGSGELSTGAKAGLGAGTGVGAVVFAAAGFFWYRRRRPSVEHDQTPQPTPAQNMQEPMYPPKFYEPHEMYSYREQSTPQELSSYGAHRTPSPYTIENRAELS